MELLKIVEVGWQTHEAPVPPTANDLDFCDVQQNFESTARLQ